MIHLTNDVYNEKPGLLSILFVVVLLAVAVIAKAQQPKKVPRIGYLSATSPSADSARIEAFRQGLRELGYVEGKTLSSSGDMQRENSIASRARGRASASQGRRHRHRLVRQQPVPPRKQLLRFPLSWRMITILLAMGSSPALRDLAGTLLDCQPLPRS